MSQANYLKYEAEARPIRVQQEAGSMRDSLPYACLHCGRRFQYMGTLSVHVGQEHMGEILSKSKQAQLKSGQDVASGVEDLDRSWREPKPIHWMPKTPCGDVGGDDFLCSEYGISFSSTQEAERARPEPPLWESPLSVGGRADPPRRVAFTRPWEDGPTDRQGVTALSKLEGRHHHEDTQTKAGHWLPPDVTSAAEAEVAAASVKPLVETDSLTSLNQEIEYVFVDEETSFLNNRETPDDHVTARDPLSIKEEHATPSEVITIKDEEEQDNADVAEIRCHEAPSEVITIDDDDEEQDNADVAGARCHEASSEVITIDDDEEEEQDNGDATVGHCQEVPFEVVIIKDEGEEQRGNGVEAEGRGVSEDPLAVSGLGGCIKEERGVYLGVEAADSKVTATGGHTSHITRTAAPTSVVASLSDVCAAPVPPHPSSGCPPALRDVGSPTSASGGATDSCGSPADPGSGGTAGGTGVERLSSDTVWELIVMAISQSPHRRATLPEMEAYIASRFPQLDCSEKGLRRSLGDVLCRDECFVAVPRTDGEQTSDCWMLDPEYEAAVETGKFGECGARRPFYRGWAAALAAVRVRAQHGGLQSHSRPPDAEPLGGLCAATASAAGVDAAPRPICPRYASTASPTSTSPSDPDVRSTCLAAPTFSKPRDSCYGDDLPTSDVTAPVDAAASPIPESGDTSDSFSDTDSEGATDDSPTGGQSEERHRGDAGLAGSADTKPPLTYSQLSAMAILDSPHRRATFSEICSYVESHFPYYEHSGGWRKSLGMTLTRDKAFHNMRLKGNDDNGHYWRLVPKYEEIFDNGNVRRHRLPKRASSGHLGAVAASEVPTSSGTSRHPPEPRLQQHDTGPSSTTGGSPLEATRDVGGGTSVTSSEHSSTAAPTSTRLSVSEVGSSGRAALDASCPDSSHCEDNTPATDTTTSTGGAGTANSASGDAADGATDTDSEGSSAGDSAGEEQGHGYTSSRPPLSYKELIAMAIAHSPNRRARHSDICAYVVKRFPYFKNKKEDWKHTIRCKLSSSKCFVKAPREDGDRKVGYWTIDPQYEETYNNGNLSRTRHPKRPFRRAPAVPRGGDASSHHRHHQRQNRASPAVRTVSTASELSVSGGGVTGGTTDPQAARCGDSAAPVADEPSHPGSGCHEDDTLVSDTDDAIAPASRSVVAADTVGKGRIAADSKGTGTGSAVHERPPFCYGELIGMAIADSPHRRAKASEICTYVASRFPYYRRCRKAWQQMLRNQLSASKCFTRERPESGRCESRWSLNPKYEHLFEGGNYRRLTSRCRHRHNGTLKRRPGPCCRRPGGVAASLPSSLHEPSTTTTTTTGQTTSKVGSVDPVSDEHSHPGSSCPEDDTPVSDTVTADDATAPASGSGVAAGTAAEGRTATDGGATAAGSSPDGAGSERQYAGRPPFCYVELIAMAIAQSPQRRATVSEVFAYIKNHFAYYRRHRRTDWRNSLRNKLYGNRCFIKEPREDGSCASHWRLNPKYEHLFEGGNYRQWTNLYRHRQQRHDSLLKWRNRPSDRRVGGGAASLHCAENKPSTTTSLTISEVRSADLVADDPSHPGSGCEDDDTPLSGDATAPASGTSVPADSGGDGRTATDSGGTAAGSSPCGAHSEWQSAGRPPFCHAELIAMAIANSPQRRATALEVFAYIKSRFPYYRRCRKDWQQMLRQRLSVNKCFIKEPRESGQHTSRWRLNPKYEHLFEGWHYRQYLHRQQRRGHDGLSERARPSGVRASVGLGASSLHGAENKPSTTTSRTISEVCSTAPVADKPSLPGSGCEDDNTPLSDDATAPASGSSVPADTGGDGRTATDSKGTAAGSSPDGARSERQSASAARTKPPFCYAELIAMAIAQSPQRRATASEMFAYVRSRFPYYRRRRKAWENVLLGQLYNSLCFTRDPHEGERRKCHWRLNPKYEHLFEGGNYRSVMRLYPTRRRRLAGKTGRRTRPAHLRACRGGGAAALPSHLHCTEGEPSTTTSRTISEVCSTAPVADEPSLPGSGCEDDDTPLSDDATSPASRSSIPADTGGDGRTATDSKGTAAGSSPDGARSELQSASAARTKPPFCYAELIAMAIAQSPQRRATASEMFAYVRSRFPYYRRRRKAWENVLLNQLYNSLCFTRESQEGDRRECHWRLNPKYEHLFEGGNYRSVMCQYRTRRRRLAGKTGRRTRPAHLRACRGGGAASMPSHLHCTEGEPMSEPGELQSSDISDGNDSASLDDSSLQNVTCDEVVMRQEESTHVTSCSVPTQEDDAFADDQFSICDVRSIKMEIFEDAIAASGFSKCIKQDPDLDLGMDATDNRVRAITGHTSDITSSRTVTLTSVLPDIGNTGRAAPDSSRSGGSTHHETDSTASDVSPQTGEAETLAYTSRGTADDATDADSESDTAGSAAEEECLGDGASTSTSNTMTRSMFRTLIAKAIMQSPHRRATLSEIYAYIASRFPCFRQKKKRYAHNRISDALRSSKRFIKVPWEGSTTRGNYWTIARDAATTSSAPGASGNCRNHVASSDGATTGADEERASADTSSASTAKTKPPFYYEELIAMAIMESPHRRATISEIVGYIARRFPYFELSSKSWQKSIQCKLCFSKFFIKERHMDGSSLRSRFNYWMLAPKYQRAFENGKFIRHQSLERPFRATSTTTAHHREHQQQQQHRASVSAEPRLLEAANQHSSDEAAPDSSHPGDCRRVADILAPDTVTSTDRAVVPTSASGVTGNCCAGGTDDDTGRAAVGSAAKSLGEDRLSGNTGSAGTTKKKPPFSYEELIAMAIVESPHRRATVTQIITYIARRFPYFERSSKDWQKSIYCKLCFSKAFIKVPLQGGSLKGRFFNYWMLNPKYKLKIRNGSLGHCRPVKQPSRRPLRTAIAPEVSPGADSSPLDLPKLRPASADRNMAISGRGGVLSPSCSSSTATLTSTRLSVSNVGSTRKAGPDSSHPGGTHCEDDSPASHATTANSAYSVDGVSDSDIEGSSAGSAADSGIEEQSRVGSGSARNASTRPPLSYKELIAMAIAQSPHRRATHPEICAYIKRRFPYFKNKRKASHHSISCALSSYKCFVKAPCEGSNKKVCYWTIDPKYKETYKNVTLHRAWQTKRPLGRAPTVSHGGGTSGHHRYHHQHNHRRQQLAGGATDPLAASAGKAVPDSSHPDCTHCEDDSPASDATTANFAHCIDGVEGSTVGGAADSAGEKQSRVGSGSARNGSTRPPLSYKELIAMAIAQSPHRRATLSEIFTYIMRRFPYFKNKRKARLRAISNTLSAGKCFIKVPWEGSNGKGNYWAIDPQYEDMFKNGNLYRQQRMERPFRRALRVAIAPLVSSAHNLPDANQQKQQQQQQQQLMGDNEQSSTATLTSTRLSISDVGSTGEAGPDSYRPDGTHCEDGSAASDTTTANSVHCIHSVTNTDIEGSTAGIAGSERCRVGSGSASNASTRPPLTYKALIAMAIAQSPHRRATRSEIFTYIMRRFPYFKSKRKSRHQTISSTLSTSKCFIKVPWEGSNRKVWYWTIDPQYEDVFKNGNLYRQRRMEQPFRRALRVVTAPLVSSAHNLPGANQQKKQQQQQPQLMGDNEQSSPVEGGCSSDDRDNPPTRDSLDVRMDDSGWCTIEREVSRVNASSVLQLPVSCASTRQRDLQEDRLGNCGRSPFSCSVCHMEFPSKYSLKLHFRVHTEGRPYSCSVCAKAFRFRQGLKRHLLVHTGERPYSCGVCRKTFTQKGHLNVHLLLHTGERPHSCGVCGKTFQQKGHLNYHLLLHTREHPYI